MELDEIRPKNPHTLLSSPLGSQGINQPRVARTSSSDKEIQRGYKYGKTYSAYSQHWKGDTGRASSVLNNLRNKWRSMEDLNDFEWLPRFVVPAQVCCFTLIFWYFLLDDNIQYHSIIYLWIFSTYHNPIQKPINHPIHHPWRIHGAGKKKLTSI